MYKELREEVQALLNNFLVIQYISYRLGHVLLDLVLDRSGWLDVVRRVLITKVGDVGLTTNAVTQVH
jgi:hypothetical protein